MEEFCHWCREKEVKPVDPPSNALVDFFSYIFQVEKASAFTIKGYRSAMSNILNFR